MLDRDLIIMGCAGYEGGRDPLEILVEGLVVEEDPIVVVFSIESIFDLANRSSNIPQIRVSCQRNERGVHFRAICCGWREARWSIRGRICRGLCFGSLLPIIVWLLSNIGESDALREIIEIF